MEVGDLSHIQHTWFKTFAFLPHRTVTGRWVWMQFIYQRVVWRYTGFVDEPFDEYADLLEVLANDENECYYDRH
jgi:hypothetical protein